jgi:hypothetical protein
MEENIMFSKKSLPISIALILLIALSTLGLAYGAWTETLTINGNVTTGTFDPSFQPAGAWFSEYEAGTADLASCTAAVSADGQNLTITIANAYPGYSCEGGANILNLGTMPVTIHDWTETPSTPFFTISLHDTAMAPVADGGSFVIPPDSTPPWTVYGGVYFNFSMPAAETGGEGLNYSFTYTLQATQ